MQLLFATVLFQFLQSTRRPSRLPKSKRASSLERPARQKLPRWRRTHRDVEIVRAVERYRALTAHHIHQLFFRQPHPRDTGPVSSRCQQRLRLLFQHGYLQRFAPMTVQGEGRRPLVYLLDKTGAEWLRSNGSADERNSAWNPKRNHIGWPFLEHLTATNDVRVSLEIACRREKCELVRWIDEQQLRSREMKDYVSLPTGRTRVAVIPDGYCQISDMQYAYHHFLEVDMATETVGLHSSSDNRKTFAAKIQAYLAYYRSGQYAQRYNTQAMRVLIVTTSTRRMENLKRVTEQVGGGSQFWFTTLSQLNSETVLHAPLWRVAGVKNKRSLLWREEKRFEAGVNHSEDNAMQQTLYTSELYTSEILTIKEA